MATNSWLLSTCSSFAFKTKAANRDELGVKAACSPDAVSWDSVVTDNNSLVVVGCSLNYNRAAQVTHKTLEFIPRMLNYGQLWLKCTDLESPNCCNGCFEAPFYPLLLWGILAENCGFEVDGETPDAHRAPRPTCVTFSSHRWHCHSSRGVWMGLTLQPCHWGSGTARKYICHIYAGWRNVHNNRYHLHRRHDGW